MSPISPARLLEAETGLDLKELKESCWTFCFSSPCILMDLGHLADLAVLTLALRILSPDSPNLIFVQSIGETWKSLLQDNLVPTIDPGERVSKV